MRHVLSCFSTLPLGPLANRRAGQPVVLILLGWLLGNGLERNPGLEVQESVTDTLRVPAVGGP